MILSLFGASALMCNAPPETQDFSVSKEEARRSIALRERIITASHVTAAATTPVEHLNDEPIRVPHSDAFTPMFGGSSSPPALQSFMPDQSPEDVGQSLSSLLTQAKETLARREAQHSLHNTQSPTPEHNEVLSSSTEVMASHPPALQSFMPDQSPEDVGQSLSSLLTQAKETLARREVEESYSTTPEEEEILSSSTEVMSSNLPALQSL